MMNNYKLVLEYDGGRYDGWQRLKRESANTLENRLREVLTKMSGSEIELNCGARTEAGVHAYGQVVNFKANVNMQPLDIQHYCNRYLPRDMAVLSVDKVPDRFHAALNASEKVYLYRIAVGETLPVFDRKYVYYCFDRPDVELMGKAAGLLEGRHDFKYFSTVKKTKSTVKELKKIEVYGDTQEIQILMTANDFLHNMPKLIAGTLLEIGLGKRMADEIPEMLTGKVPAGEQAAAQGLFLQEIRYDQKHLY